MAVAHSLDDQAETFLLRLIRGSGPRGLAGILPRAGRVIRPLLEIPRVDLRQYAAEQGLTWREDASNESEDYLRNRLRRALAECPPLTDHLLALGAACSRLEAWTRTAAPELAASFATGELVGQLPILAREAARRAREQTLPCRVTLC